MILFMKENYYVNFVFEIIYCGNLKLIVAIDYKTLLSP